MDEKTIKWHEQQIRIKKLANRGKLESLEGQDRIDALKYAKRYKSKANRTLRPINRYYRVDKQPRAYSISREYDFLKYLPLVFSWALKQKPDLGRLDLEALIYLYGHGHFLVEEFKLFIKAFRGTTPSCDKMLQSLVDRGYVRLVRKKTYSTKEIYGLTDSCSLFIGKIHKYCCGVEKIPRQDMTFTRRVERQKTTYAKNKNRKLLNLIARMDKDIDNRD